MQALFSSRDKEAYQDNSEKQGQSGESKSSLFYQGNLSCQSPSGSEVLRSRVEEVITSFNTAMEQSQQRTEKLRQVVMKEVDMLVAMYEEATTRKQEAPSEGMNKLLASLGTDMNWEAESDDWEWSRPALGVLALDRPGERLMLPLPHSRTRVPLAKRAGWKVRGSGYKIMSALEGQFYSPGEELEVVEQGWLCLDPCCAWSNNIWSSHCERCEVSRTGDRRNVPPPGWRSASVLLEGW